MFDFFRRDKDKQKKKHEGVDELTAAFVTSLHIAQRPQEGPQHFVGGFDERYVQNDRVHNNGPALGPSPQRPQTKPLPTPPRMSVPQSVVGTSRTMGYAHVAEHTPFPAPQYVKGSLRPPEVPHRPHSAPVPRASSPPRRVSASHVPLATGNATPPTRRRRRASSSASLPPTNVTEGLVHCNGVTKAGNRCSRKFKASSVLTSLTANVDGEVECFCFQHRSELLVPTGFYTKKTNPETWIDFADWIPDYLHEETQASLRAEMAKLASKRDVDGYIYTFEIRDGSKSGRIQLKVGRAVNIVKRIDEWSKQCGSKEQVLRGYWPSGLHDDDGPLMRGRVQAGEPGRCCHRVERLVHLELGDLSENAQYLHKDFPRKSSGPASKSAVRNARKKVQCPDCSKFHQEIFTFIRPTHGPYVGKEWDMLVKPVIEKWGGFVDAFC